MRRDGPDSVLSDMSSRLKDKVLNGQKTCFIRVVQYFDRESIFYQFGAAFKITKVEKGTLDEVCLRVWDKAGYDSYNELYNTWLELHGEYNQKQQVWVHYFERVK